MIFAFHRGAATSARVVALLVFTLGCGGPKLNPFEGSSVPGGGGGGHGGSVGSSGAAHGGSAGSVSGGSSGTAPSAGSAGDVMGGASAGTMSVVEGGTDPGVAGAASEGGTGVVVDPGSVCAGQLRTPESLLSDCETGLEGWFGYVDGAEANVTEQHPGADDSSTAAHFAGGEAEESGMGIGMFCDDVSGFDGVAFWARGPARIRFLVAIPATDATPGRGDCDPDKLKCNDHPGVALELDDEWTLYSVHWDELEQYGWGEPASFDGIVNSLLWINDGPVDSFELAVDDVRLFKSKP